MDCLYVLLIVFVTKDLLFIIVSFLLIETGIPYGFQIMAAKREMILRQFSMAMYKKLT